MGNGLDIYTIIFLVLAVVIFFRLRSVLGERTGHEKPPEPRVQERFGGGEDNVVPLPGRDAPQMASRQEDTDLRHFAREGTALYDNLEELMRREPQFEPAQFLANAKQAYEMIVQAFARGERKTLSELLAKDVYEGFISAIEEREEAGQELTTDFIGFDDARFVDVAIEGEEAYVTVRFESNIISHTKDSEGRIITGDPSEVQNVIDVWTFSRRIGAETPVWYLSSTEYEKV